MTNPYYCRELPKVDQIPPMSKMNSDFHLIQTRVPPSNPFSQVEQKTDPYTNHSLDHHVYPIKNFKSTIHAPYLARNREGEIQKQKSAESSKN